MDFVNPVNSRGDRPERRGSLLKRLTIWCASLLVGLILLLLALPTILSNDAVLSWLLTRVNASLAPATVKVERFNLAWFQEQTLTGIRYTDPARGIEATVKELRLASLCKLLPVGKITVDCTVDTPEITLSAPQPLPGVPLPETTTRDAIATTEPTQILLPAWDIALNLTIQKGRLTHEILPEPLISNLACTITLPELSAAPTLALNTALLDGTLTAKATLAPVEKLLAATTPAETFSTAELALAAEWAIVELNAKPLPNRAYPGGTLTLSVPCDTLLRRLRSLNLPLPKDVEGLAGVLSLTGAFEAAAKNEGYRLSTSLQAQNLTGMIEGKRLTLSPSLNLIAEFDPANLIEGRVERLSVDLPGVMASGSGSLKSGTLAARAEVNTVLATLAPFLGECTLPKPVTVNLTATATPTALTLSATAGSTKEELATLTVNGAGVNLAERTVASLKTTLQADLAALAPFFFPDPNRSLAGTLYLNTSLSGALRDWQAKALLAVRAFRFDSAAWQISEPSLLEGSFSCGATDGELRLSDLALKLPVGDAAGNFSGGRLELAGTLNPQRLINWRREPGNLFITGTPTWQFTVTAAETPHLTATVAADPFTLALPSGSLLDLPFSLAVAGEAAAGRLTLPELALSLPPLALDSSATYDTASGLLEATGTLTPDLDRLWELPFCDALREAGITLSGRNASPFTFTAPLRDGLAGILNNGSGETTLCFERITVPGLDIPGGRATVTLKDAVAALDGTFRVNNGAVTLAPRLNLADRPMRLSLPDDTPLVTGIALSQPLLDTSLSRVNPLLTGTVSPGGTLSLHCNSCTFTLDDPLGTLEADLAFSTRACAFAPSGNLNILINLLRLTRRSVELPDQTVALTVDRGLLTCDTVEFNIPPARLNCSGTTNLKTGEVNYLVQLPLTEQLLGRRLARVLTVDRILELPVVGSTHKPVLQTGPLLELLRSSAVGVGVSKLSSRVGTILRKGGEIGLEIGGAAGDAVETGGEVGANTLEALKSLFEKDEK